MFLVYLILVKKIIKKVLICLTGSVTPFMSKYKVAMFDMDGTLLQGRGIFVIAEKKGFLKDLERLIGDNRMEFYEKSIEVAKLLKNHSKQEFLEIFRGVPLQNHVESVINELKKKGILTAVITDSYKFLAEDLREKLSIDYVFANELTSNEDVITGELKIHNKGLREDFISNRIYSICKSCVLEDLSEDLGIKLNATIAVGDGIVDIGMIKKAGLGIAFNASKTVKKYADVATSDMRTLLKYV